MIFTNLMSLIIFIFSCSSGNKTSNNSKNNLEVYSSEDVSLSKQSGSWEEVINICRNSGMEAGLKFAGLHYGSQKWNASFWSMVGDCYNLNQQLTKARIFYTKSLTLQKNFPQALVGLSTVMAKFDNPYEALNLLNIAQNNNPTSDLVRWSLGQFYLAWGLNGSSLKNLLKISSDYRPAMVNRSVAMNYVLMDNMKLAIDIFKDSDSALIDLNVNSRFLFAYAKRKNSGESTFTMSNDFQFDSHSPLQALIQIKELKSDE